MSYRKHLEDEFHRNELTVSKSRLFFVSNLVELLFFLYNSLSIMMTGSYLDCLEGSVVSSGTHSFESK